MRRKVWFLEWATVLAWLIPVLVAVIVWQGVLVHRYRTRSEDGPAAEESTPTRVTRSHEADTPSQASPRPAPGPVVRESMPPESFPVVSAREGTEEESIAAPEVDTYRGYVEDLRAQGYSEQVIEETVVADVMAIAATERDEVITQYYNGFEYWRSNAETREGERELLRRRMEVDKWVQSTVRDYLGRRVDVPSTAAAWRQAELQAKVSFLPIHKQDQTRTVLEQYADVDRTVRALVDNRKIEGTQEDWGRAVDDYVEKLETLGRLLTPREYERLDMTVSWTADNLRRAMTKFEPTEQEFQAIFREWRAQDENLAVGKVLGTPDPGKEHVFESISKYLTPDRYQQYRNTWWK